MVPFGISYVIVLVLMIFLSDDFLIDREILKRVDQTKEKTFDDISTIFFGTLILKMGLCGCLTSWTSDLAERLIC